MGRGLGFIMVFCDLWISEVRFLVLLLRYGWVVGVLRALFVGFVVDLRFVYGYLMFGLLC